MDYFRNPTKLFDRHIVVFFFQLLVIAVTTFGGAKFFYNYASGYGNYELVTKDTYIDSLIDDIKSDAPKDKRFVKLPGGKYDKEYTQTDKFIDLKRGGIWLTDRQDVIFSGYLCACILSSIILTLAGAGKIFSIIRWLLGRFSDFCTEYFKYIIPFRQHRIYRDKEKAHPSLKLNTQKYVHFSSAGHTESSRQGFPVSQIQIRQCEHDIQFGGLFSQTPISCFSISE